MAQTCVVPRARPQYPTGLVRAKEENIEHADADSASAADAFD